MRIEASPTGFSLTLIDESGRLLICGQTFLEGNEYVSRFVEVPQLPPVIRATAGADRCAAVTTDGRLFTWGGSPMPGDAAADPRCVAVNPKEVVFPRGEKVTDAAVGDLFSAALTASGRLYRWGETDGAGEGGETATGGCLFGGVTSAGFSVPVTVSGSNRQSLCLSMFRCSAAGRFGKFTAVTTACTYCFRTEVSVPGGWKRQESSDAGLGRRG